MARRPLTELARRGAQSQLELVMLAADLADSPEWILAGSPTTRQKLVVKERDRTCVDCGRTTLLEYDHVPAYETTGRTLVDELQLRCAPCHHRRHAVR